MNLEQMRFELLKQMTAQGWDINDAINQAAKIMAYVETGVVYRKEAKDGDGKAETR